MKMPWPSDEIRNKPQRAKSQGPNPWAEAGFEHWRLGPWDLFRISGFGFRTLASGTGATIHRRRLLRPAKLAGRASFLSWLILAGQLNDVATWTMNLDPGYAVTLALKRDFGLCGRLRSGGGMGRASRDRNKPSGLGSVHDRSGPRIGLGPCRRGSGRRERHEFLFHGVWAMGLAWSVTLPSTRLPSWTLSCTDTRRLISSLGRVFSIGWVSATPDTLKICVDATPC